MKSKIAELDSKHILSESITGLLSQYENEFDKLSLETFRSHETNTCPKCGFNLSSDDNDTKEKAFNYNKASHLAELSDSIKKQEKTSDEIGSATLSLMSDIKELESKIKSLNDDMEAKSTVPLQVNPEEEKQQKRIHEIQAEIDKLDAMIHENKPPNTSGLEAIVITERSKLAQIETTRSVELRIDELGTEEKNLAMEFENLEHETFLMDQFIVQKVKMLDSKINSKFELARFKLSEVQINGGVKEVCETLYHGSPYNGGLSTGEQIVIGLDIIKTLQDHYNTKSCIFMDHRESLTSKPMLIVN